MAAPRDSSAHAAEDFRTTHWSVVLAAADADSPRCQSALTALCQSYRYPLYAFVRRQGRNPHEAEDLTQDFFARRLARSSLASVSPGNGRFRSFLLASMKNFLANDWDRNHAVKRGGNPRQQDQIERLDFVSPKSECAPFLLPSRWNETPECIMSHLARQTGSAAILALTWMVCTALPAAAQLVETNSLRTHAITLRTKESSLGKVPNLADLKRMTNSPDFMHVAYPVMRGGKWVVNLDGIDGPKHDQVRGLKFSPDGKRLAYQALRGDVPVVVVDGKEGTEFERLEDGYPIFSPDSKHFIYWGSRSNRVVIVEDGRDVGVYDHVGTRSLIFSPDSRHSCHVGRMGKKSFVVMDGVKGPEFDDVLNGCPVFSPDSRHWVYGAKQNGKMVIVMDGVTRRSVRDLDVAAFVFSPDGRRLAYCANEANDWRVVVDEKEGRRYDGIGGDLEDGLSIVFSPNSQRLAYVASRGDKQLVVVDGKEEPEVGGVITPGGLIFSPDSRRVAYACQRRGKYVVVLDGEEGPTFDGIAGNSLQFSPNSKRFAYAAWRGQEWFAVIDGIESQVFETIVPPGPVFSPDSQHIAYGGGTVGIGGQGWFIVDGEKSETYDYLRGFRFENSNLIRAIAARNDVLFNKEFLRVEIEIREK